MDSPLDYNLLLGRSWTYVVQAIPSSIFWVLVFPRNGKIVSVDQLSFTQKSTTTPSKSTVPMVDQVCPAIENLGVGMYSSLIGTFELFAPFNYIGSISIGNSKVVSRDFFAISNQTDPWILPTNVELVAPLSMTKIAYQDLQETVMDSISTRLVSEE